ncbi:MAG: crossover junction endodeoxyribonuclease RuvC, partial [Erythrobacter cryptus]
MIILGLDPSLSSTGWGVIRAEGARLAHIAHGEIATAAAAPMAERLALLHAGIAAVIAAHRPARAAIEEVFVNRNPQS